MLNLSQDRRPPRWRRGLGLGLRGNRDHLYEIECLRGLAVLLVFLFHARGITSGNPPGDMGPLQAFIAVGNTGVTLFFVLSGFLLSRPWLEATLLGRKAPDLRNYVVARALRILPLYYLAIAVAALDLGTAELILPAASFRMLGFSYFPHSAVWWTLITELQFYLLLPVMGWLALAPRRRPMLGLLCGIWLIAYINAVLLAGGSIDGFWLTKSLFARLPAFLFGILAAALLLKARPLRAEMRLALLLAALVGLALLLQSVARIGESTAEHDWPWYHIPEALAWSGVLLALAGSNTGWWRLPLVNAPLAVLGKLSYSIYLNHVPLLFYIVYPSIAREAPMPERLQSVAIAAVASLILAAITYALVERPALRLKGRLNT